MVCSESVLGKSQKNTTLPTIVVSNYNDLKHHCSRFIIRRADLKQIIIAHILKHLDEGSLKVKLKL